MLNKGVQLPEHKITWLLRMIFILAGLYIFNVGSAGTFHFEKPGQTQYSIEENAFSDWVKPIKGKNIHWSSNEKIGVSTFFSGTDIGKAAKGGLSTTRLVQKSATLAERAVGGTGRFAGTAKHTYANNLLSRYQSIHGSRGLQFNNYFNNGVGNRGFLDVVNHGSKTIYDFKFGSATWRSGQLLKYQRNFPGYNIQIIRP
jgi:hypothetical protein